MFFAGYTRELQLEVTYPNTLVIPTPPNQPALAMRFQNNNATELGALNQNTGHVLLRSASKRAKAIIQTKLVFVLVLVLTLKVIVTHTYLSANFPLWCKIM